MKLTVNISSDPKKLTVSGEGTDTAVMHALLAAFISVSKLTKQEKSNVKKFAMDFVEGEWENWKLGTGEDGFSLTELRVIEISLEKNIAIELSTYINNGLYNVPRKNRRKLSVQYDMLKRVCRGFLQVSTMKLSPRECAIMSGYLKRGENDKLPRSLFGIHDLFQEKLEEWKRHNGA